MPSYNSTVNWFKYSQIEYFTPFIKLWLSLNSWYKQSLSGINTDRDAINSIKASSPIKEKFVELLDSDGDDGIELRNSLASLFKELRLQMLFDDSGNTVSFPQTDTLPSFRALSQKAKARKLNEGSLVILDPETVAIDNKPLLFQEAMEVIYQIRCSLIHGDFDIESQRAHRLIRNAYIILNKTFGPCILTEE